MYVIYLRRAILYSKASFKLCVSTVATIAWLHLSSKVIGNLTAVVLYSYL